MPWFRKKEDAPPAANPPSAQAIEVPLPAASSSRFRVNDVWWISGADYVAVGEVLSGEVRPGMRLSIRSSRNRPPDLESVRVSTIDVKHRKVPIAVAGDRAGLYLSGPRPNGPQGRHGSRSTLDLGRDDLLVG